jgi:hypothetical protein
LQSYADFSLFVGIFTCFLKELQMRKLFHWHYVLTQICYLEQEPKRALPKFFACSDEIMRRDEIR